MSEEINENPTGESSQEDSQKAPEETSPSAEAKKEVAADEKNDSEGDFALTESELFKKVEEIKTEIGRKLVGQHHLVELVIVGLLSDGHILIEGVPGVAKTYTARLLSAIFDASFSRIQFTPDLMPSDVTGTNIFNAKLNEFEFKSGPIFSNVVLIDEINRAPAKTQAALFECMEEQQVSMDGVTHNLPQPFIVLGTQNPVEHEGTYKLPEAQLDRFMFKIEVDYPNIDDEVKILMGTSANTITKDLSDVKNVLSIGDLLKFKAEIQKIRIEEKLIRYIAQLVQQTREDSQLYLGASPRASISILQSSKALAAIHGRDFVTPEDIREVTVPVLNHRIVLTPEKEIEGIKTSDVIQEIIDAIEIPR